MSKTIRVDDDVYEELRKRGVPLVDTPNKVLRRLLGLDPELSKEDQAKTAIGK